MPDLGEATSSVSDLQFISEKVRTGDWIEVSDSTTTIEYVVPSGKTFFFFSARSIWFTSLPTGAFNNQAESDLFIDSVLKDKIKTGGTGQIGGATNADNANSNYSSYSDFTFNVTGLFLVGDGVKTIEIDGGTGYFKTIRGWIENT